MHPLVIFDDFDDFGGDFGDFGGDFGDFGDFDGAMGGAMKDYREVDVLHISSFFPPRLPSSLLIRLIYTSFTSRNHS